MPTLFLTKAPKLYDGQNTSLSKNDAGKSGYLPAEDKNSIHACLPV
jgi:hypothetical protein